MTLPDRVRTSLGAVAAGLRNPALRRLQVAFALSATTQWAASLAVTAYVFGRGGAAAVALQLVTRMVPAAIAAPLMATLADRYPRVRVMVASDLGRALLFLATAALLMVDAPLAAIFAVGAVNGILATVFEPAKAALLPSLAREPAELTAANVLSSSIDSVSFFVGPALGGLLLAVASPAAALVVTAAGLVASAVLVARIPETRAARDAGEEAEPSFLGEVATGFRTVAQLPAVRLIVAFVVAQTFVDGLAVVLVAALALDLLDLGGSGLGVLNSAIGIGALVGAVAAAALIRDTHLARPFMLGCVLWGVPFILMGAVPVPAVAFAALLIVGLGNTLVDVSSFTLLQRSAPEQVLARVFGVMEALILLSVALGAALGPVLIDGLGVEGALVVTGAVLPVLVALRAGALQRLDAGLANADRAADVAVLRGVPILAPLDGPVLERLAAGLDRRRVPAGTDVVVQGDPGDEFFVVVSGDVEVRVDDRVVGREGPGGAFGEIALLRDVPRTATVRTTQDTDLRVLARAEFLHAVTTHPGSLAAANELAAGRARPSPPLVVA